LKREDIPEPNYVINSSPDKWQVIWKVEGCGKEQAEEINRGMVRETGADPAATDVARVLRLPGFYNHKYGHPHLVTVESRSNRATSPEQLPQFPTDVQRDSTRTLGSSAGHRDGITQSERDWAYVKRSLARGTDPTTLMEELRLRRADKSDPADYARRTVGKAVSSLNQQDYSEPER